MFFCVGKILPAAPQCQMVILLSHVSSYKNILDHAKAKITEQVGPKQTWTQACLIFWNINIIKILTWTKDEVYLWSHRVVWNNGVLDVAQTDGSLVYLYIHISQAWALASKAQGWETKSSHQSHICVLVRARTHTRTHTSHDLTLHTTGPLCSSHSQPGLALPGPP